MPFSPGTVSSLKAVIDQACADPRTDIPGATVAIVGRDGEELLAHAAGWRGLAGSQSCSALPFSSSSSPAAAAAAAAVATVAGETEEPMTLDTVFWLASCTKLVAGIACMQLVERGLLNLDDGDRIEALCPELGRLQVLGPDGQLVDKKTKITLRMLLSHTAGFGYTFFNERLRDWALPLGVDEFSGRLEHVTTPLLFQPGEGWEYGVGIDWAGIALERATGLSLNDYMQQNIFQPLGIKDMSMFPSKDMRSRLAYMHQRDKDGTLKRRDHLFRVPLAVDPDNKDEVGRILNSGGAGLFGRPQEYCRILATLLNDGTSPTTGAQILRPETVTHMFTNQIPHLPDFSRQGMQAAKPELTNPIPELYPVEGRPPQGWGLTFHQTNGGPTGRSPAAVSWAGLANLWWWCDREKGIAGIVATQILPFADAKVLGLWFGVEGAAYVALEKDKL